jgi:hypothetical protein
VSVVIPAACYLKLFGGTGGASRGSKLGGLRRGAGKGVRGVEEDAEDEDDDDVDLERAPLLGNGNDVAGTSGGSGSGSSGNGGLKLKRVSKMRRGLSTWETVLCWTLLVYGIVGAVVATIGSCWPGVRPGSATDPVKGWLVM